PAGRAAFLDRACAGDPDLRRQVDELLAAHAEAGGFLEPPGAGSATAAHVPGTGTSSLSRADTNATRSAGEPDATRTSAGRAGGSRTTTATGDLIAGRYRLGPPLGEGSMGRVLRAEQVEPVRRTVALKLIRPGMDTDRVIARFGAERQALAVMDHPN